jgi:tight adherence protein B
MGDTSSFMNILMLGGGALMSVLLIGYVLIGGKEATPDKRLARVGGEAPIRQTRIKNDTPQTVKRTTIHSSIPILDRILKAVLPRPEKMRARLERTGKTIKIGEYVLINALSVFLWCFILKYMAGMAPAAALPLGIAIGLLLPHWYTGRMGAKRVRAFIASFPEAIDTMCRGLRSGLPITESISACGREMPDPVGIEFRRISDGVRMGRSLDESMWDVAKRIDAPEYRFLIIAMSIQRETGGNLAETLGNLSELIRKRRQLRLKIRAMSSEARASAMIIGSLPFLMFGILMLVNPDYMMLMLTDKKGMIMTGFALGMIGMGIGAMAKMIKFEI